MTLSLNSIGTAGGSMDRQTEENINRYIRYRLGPPKFLLGFALCFAVGCTALIFGAYFLGVLSRALHW
jgi:hypothetical protein